jgi:hypothetical protein
MFEDFRANAGPTVDGVITPQEKQLDIHIPDAPGSGSKAVGAGMW